jgi:hypothetical protein
LDGKKNKRTVTAMSNEPEFKCELCGKKLKKSECYEYEQYTCLCWDCWQNEEEEDDLIPLL